MKKLVFTSTILLTGILLAGCAPLKHEATHIKTTKVSAKNKKQSNAALKLTCIKNIRGSN